MKAEGTSAIVGGRVITVTDGVKEGCTILVREGLIEDLRPAGPVPDGYEVIDARGKIVIPGMIDPHTHIGLFEEGVGSEGDDVNEGIDPAAPDLRGLDGVNPFDLAFREACMAGITAVIASPGSASVIGGTSLAMKTYGKNLREMILLETAGVKMAMGRNPQFHFRSKEKFPSTRMGVAALIREELTKAANYSRKLEDEAASSREKPERSLKMEALAGLLRREYPARVHAANQEDIVTIIRIAGEFGFDIVLDHVTEGHLVPEVISRHNVPCVLGPMMVAGKSVQTRNLTFSTARVLAQHGVKIALTTDHPVIPLKYLTIQAALAVKAGLPEDEALRAITINAAEIMGLSHRIGSIEVGKDADIVIMEGDPLDVYSRVICTLVSGQVAWRADAGSRGGDEE